MSNGSITNRKVIIICDAHSDDTAELVGHLLKEERGDEVECVQYSQQALAEIGQSPPDLIVLNIMMHSVDGLSLPGTQGKSNPPEHTGSVSSCGYRPPSGSLKDTGPRR
jgi:CheY-like chemotaxis protein